jgi:hypothetical protein
MTGELGAHQCDEYGDNLAELALGILTGRERAATLAHVDSCAHCAEELEQLSRAADAVVRVAPEMEPPLGFETRLFSRMGLPAAATENEHEAKITPLRRGRGTTPPRWVWASAAAAVALVVGLSIGWTTGHHGPARTRPEVAAANLTSDGKSVGRVLTYGGSKPWMIVTLADSRSDGRVTCEVVTDNGTTYKVGTFSATDGYGAWGAPLRVAPQDVRKAEVVSSSGTVIATATLS